jgi:hypothetical protein
VAGQNSTPFQGICSKKSLLPGSTGSDATFITIMNAIQDCTRNHSGCNRAQASSSNFSQFPKRILELTNDRVLLREDLSVRSHYACLSHCWGNPDDVTQTTLTSLQDFKIEVPWNKLTKSFRDAIDICRRLGIKFLWIDSLCIIQDCESDWNDQSKNMASIYENAFLTIAATKSKDSTAGCYSTTEPDFLAVSVPTTGVYVRKQHTNFPTSWSQKTPEQWPLLDRGWIYQEMRLSRRVLHFCSEEVIWECRDCRKSESGCSDEAFDRDKPQYEWLMYESVPYWKLAENPRLLWYRTVQEYSSLRLTLEKDKFPALAALSKGMENLRIGDRFLAGLWEKTLLLDLLWMVWPSPKTGRLSTWRAPTWSWASVQSQVIWKTSVDSVISSVKVVDICYTTRGPPLLGDIIEAVIVLRAPLIRASIRNGEISLDRDNLLLGEVIIRDEKKDYVFSIPGQYHISSDSEIFVVPMGIERSISGSEANVGHSGIVTLKRRNDSFYERVGHVKLQHRELKEMLEEEDKWEYADEDIVGKKTDRVNSILESLPVHDIALL